MLLVNMREAVRSLLGSKQRTILALLGVIIGIGSVMAMLTIGASIKEEALQQFRLMGTDVLDLSCGFGSQQEPGGKFTEQFVDRLAKYGRLIRRVSPEIENFGEIAAGGEQQSGGIKGVREEFFLIKRLRAGHGRLLCFLDQGRPHVLLGAGIAQKLQSAGAEGSLEQVSIKGLPFTVVGVLEPADLGYFSDEIDNSVFLTLDMAARFMNTPGISKATVQIMPEADHVQAQSEILQMADAFGMDPGGLEVRSPRKILEQMERQMALYTLLLAAVGSISLVVGGVGIMNMMLVSVTERRREIGIRRALGAHQRDIVSQFLVESVILSLSGGLIGTALGLGIGVVVSQVKGIGVVVSPQSIALCLTVAMGVGLVFGYYPAKKAAAMDVILALKAD